MLQYDGGYGSDAMAAHHPDVYARMPVPPPQSPVNSYPHPGLGAPAYPPYSRDASSSYPPMSMQPDDAEMKRDKDSIFS